MLAARRGVRQVLEERWLSHISGIGFPGVDGTCGRRQVLPVFVAVPDALVFSDELIARQRRIYRDSDLLRRRPDVGKEHGAVRSHPQGLGGEIYVNASRQGVGDAKGRRSQVRGPYLRVHATFEVPVAGKDSYDRQVAVIDLLGDLGDEGTRVSDAGRAPVSDQGKTKLVQVRRKPGTIQVVGHHPGPGGQRGLHPRPGRQPCLEGVLGKQARCDHHRGVRCVGTRGDGRDHHRTVARALGRGRRFGKRFAERGSRRRQANPVLRALWPRHRGLDCRKIQFQHLGEDGFAIAVSAEQALLLRVGLHQRYAIASTGELQIPEDLFVYREISRSRPVLGTHVRQRRAVCHRQRR